MEYFANLIANNKTRTFVASSFVKSQIHSFIRIPQRPLIPTRIRRNYKIPISKSFEDSHGNYFGQNEMILFLITS
jgi:hypothetical protein